MLEVIMQDLEHLTEEEKADMPNNGCGKDMANYLRVLHNGKTIALESDAMEPEDVRFYRDLSWIEPLLRQCYQLGKEDASR